MAPSFNREMAELGKGNWRRVLEKLSEMRRLAVSPDQISVSVVANAVGSKAWQHSCMILEDSRCQVLETNTISCGATLGACEKGGQWQMTASMLTRMNLESLETSVIAGNAALSAFAAASRWLQSLRTMGHMRVKGLEPDCVSCSAVMETSTVDGGKAARRWQTALRLLHTFRGRHVKLDVVAWTSVSSVCTRECNLWTRCLDILACMEGQKCLPNAITYRIAYLACEAAEAFQPGKQLLERSRADPAYLLWAMAKLSVRDPARIHGRCLRALRFLARARASAAQVAAVCWAASALGVVGFLETLPSYLPRFRDCSFQELMVVAWSFAASPSPSISTLQAVQQEACRHLARWSSATLDDVPKQPLDLVPNRVEEAMGLLGACTFAGHLEPALRQRTSRLVHDAGKHQDDAQLRCQGLGTLSCAKASLAEDVPMHEPCFRLDLADRAVVHKPPGWEVHDLHEALQLSAWVRAQYLRVPILRASHFDFGFLHRLDVPSSGLLLVAKSFEAFYDLQLQVALNQLGRAYLVLCHGWLPDRLVECTWQLRSEGQISVVGSGKPCRTSLHARRHLCLNSGAFSLLNVTISTGRMHQIRSHLAHAGHPTVSDGKYTSEGTFGSDLAWCPRNFLHRYQVSFRDSEGVSLRVMAPLVTDLDDVVKRMACRRAKFAEKPSCLFEV